MLLELIKSPDGKLIPIGDETVSRVSKMKSGDTVFVEYKPRRNYQFHKKAFSLLKLVFDNQSIYSNMEDLRTEFKLKAGWYQEHITTKGKVIYLPKSMSFADMDAVEFEEIYSKFIDIALKHFVTFNKQELEEQILRYC
jgi:hypothetical protein